jgi:hypothetical protein
VKGQGQCTDADTEEIWTSTACTLVSATAYQSSEGSGKSTGTCSDVTSLRLVRMCAHDKS